MTDTERMEAFKAELQALLDKHHVTLSPGYSVQEAMRQGAVTVEVTPEIRVNLLPVETIGEA